MWKKPSKQKSNDNILGIIRVLIRFIQRANTVRVVMLKPNLKLLFCLDVFFIYLFFFHFSCPFLKPVFSARLLCMYITCILFHSICSMCKNSCVFFRFIYLFNFVWGIFFFSVAVAVVFINMVFLFIIFVFFFFVFCVRLINWTWTLWNKCIYYHIVCLCTVRFGPDRFGRFLVG